MSDDKDKIDSILDQVQPERRTFLKRLVGGGALAILALPASSLLAQETLHPTEGKGDGKAMEKVREKVRVKAKVKARAKATASPNRPALFINTSFS